jgi:hypothetical protein
VPGKVKKQNFYGKDEYQVDMELKEKKFQDFKTLQSFEEIYASKLE